MLLTCICKIAVGPEAVGCIDIEAPVIDNLKAVAKAKNKDVEDVVATILNRERHAKSFPSFVRPAPESN